MASANDERHTRTVRRRGVDAAAWGIPAVNYALMRDAAERLGCGPNQVVYWSRLLDWRNQTLTPNPDAIYFMPFYDVSQGPVVLEIPAATDDGAAIIGSVMDGWQVPLEDVGKAGVDQGAGGRYLILPPAFEGDVPPGYVPLRSEVDVGYALLRSSIASGEASDVEAAVAYGKQLAVYPLSEAGAPADTVFVDAADADFDATIAYDVSFFEVLADFVQHQPWLERDRVMIDVLRSLGIAKGTTFAPDDETRAALSDAAGEAREWLDGQYVSFFATPFIPGTGWALPASPELVKAASTGFDAPDSYPSTPAGARTTGPSRASSTRAPASST
ncbi:hypothetical protein Slu03_12270 [Sediminihabitans luteus]|uniref:DUF1254 domain-containing protein n=1 Tax=Sediminihabitans luteus TaxID=1138585 RepID=UPI001950DC04|nr:DUF1254 domain-containing protein [Sediminihabitans luteus]GII98849.1 hypothetical protein Slu03_12270 [Sediminihabitans luteus]